MLLGVTPTHNSKGSKEDAASSSPKKVHLRGPPIRRLARLVLLRCAWYRVFVYVCVCMQGYRVCTNTNVLMASHELCCSSSSVAQSCLTLCNPMNCSTTGLPALHYLLELAHTHVHRVDDCIQPSHPLSPPSPPALSLSQHQGLFQ